MMMVSVPPKPMDLAVPENEMPDGEKGQKAAPNPLQVPEFGVKFSVASMFPVPSKPS